MFQPSTRVTIVTLLCLFCGQSHLVSSSVQAEDANSISADLVELAIPQAVSDFNDADDGQAPRHPQDLPPAEVAALNSSLVEKRSHHDPIDV